MLKLKNEQFTAQIEWKSKAITQALLNFSPTFLIMFLNNHFFPLLEKMEMGSGAHLTDPKTNFGVKLWKIGG